MHPFDTISNSLFTCNTERERQFLSNLRSDWLDDVMIKDNSPGTCEWVLSSQVFQAWLSGSGMVLWILGNAGAGKTVLAKFLYRQLCDVFAGDAISSSAHKPQWASSSSKLPSRPRHVLAYFLDVNSPLRNSSLSVLQSLLYQILSTEQDLFRYIHGKPIFSRPQQGNFGQYAEVLSAILRDPSLRGTIIVLDALDECGPTSQLKIIDMLSNLAYQSSIQLLVTSRPNKDPNSNFLLDLSKSEEHDELDIKRYAEEAIRQLAVARDFSEDLRDLITRRILRHSSKGFLWVQLVLQSISKARTVRMVRDRLMHLPQDLREAYSDCFNGTTNFTDVNMRRTLYFVMIAEKPLQIRDLSALLALSHCWDHISTDHMVRKPKSTGIGMIFDLNEITENQTIRFERDFRKNFQPLLSLNESSVSLVHYSLREFLEMSSEIDKFHATFDRQSLKANDLRQVHGIMAALCLQYMLAAFQGHDDPLDFLDFACFHWTEHVRKAEGFRSFHLDDLVRLFFEETNYASTWLSKVANAQATRGALLPLKADITFIFAAFDLCDPFGDILGISAGSLESTDQEQRTPLHLAAANNSLSSIKWIQSVLSSVGKDLGILATKKDSKGESPISLAAKNGNGEIMTLLLVSIKSKYEYDPGLFKTLAVSQNIEMFETLYGYTNINTPDQGMALLTHAAGLDSVDLMKRILSDHGRPDSKQDVVAVLHGSNGDPLLHVALRRQAFRVFNYLLARGYPAAVVDRDGNTPLHIATQEGSERVSKDLIEAMVPVNVFNKSGDTPLHIASRIGLPVLVRLLCGFGANVNLAGSSGCLPAHLAAATGQEELIDILLRFGTNINATDGTGRTALHVAAGAGQGSTLACLLNKGADVDVRDDEGRTPVHYAVQSGDLSILYMLCEAGADLSASEYSNISPLHLAAESGSEILVRELIRLGTDPDPRDSEGKTPLHYSCLSKRSTSAVVRTLLEAGAEVNMLDRQGLSPLHYACKLHAGLSKNTKEEVVRILLNNNADVSQQSNDLISPLHYAIENGDPVIIRLLRNAGATNPTDVWMEMRS